jgi:putative serine protease PepD
MSSLRSIVPIAAGAAAGAVVALAIASGSSGSTHTVTTVVSNTSPTNTAVATAFSKNSGESINNIYRHDSSGVVDITVTAESTSSGLGFFGGSGKQESEDEGAGVVFDKKGDIITDEHVVANAISVEVHFQDGVNAAAKVLGEDPNTDVAVIHVNVPSSELDPIQFANSDEAQVGDSVIAIGSPFSLPETVTAGIVSQVGRSITAPNGFTISGSIQTDAAINPGNSGGPLLDATGDVLGLNDQIQTNGGADQSAGIGFATPANEDVHVANTIISGHKVAHAYVGVCLSQTSTVGAQIATSSSVTCETPVVAGSPAAKAGLKPGDTIIGVDGHKVASTDDFIEMIGNYQPGQTVTFRIRTPGKNGQVRNIQIILGNRPATAPTGG